MWSLEYALLFGVPGNKIEMDDARSRWAFPFSSRAEAEGHFADWLATLARWKQAASPPVAKGQPRWKAQVAGIEMELYPRPIEMRFPMDPEAFGQFLRTFWNPSFWSDDRGARRRDFWAQLDHQDVAMNLWTLFGAWQGRHGGRNCGRVDIALSDTAVVAPDQYYYCKPAAECMIDGEYFRGPPDLIAEVFSPASIAIDRGPRRELYRRSRVPHLWLIDPEDEYLETYELAGSSYRHTATHRPGDRFAPALFPDETVVVESLFRTQAKKGGDRPLPDDPEPLPEWLLPPESQLGLEYFFLLGHPERRWEIWGNKATSVLAFGSVAEARHRLRHFVVEACAWEGLSAVEPSPIDEQREIAEIGRFRLHRHGRHVHLDVLVDARKLAALMPLWNDRAAWDWGER
jgi:Uma2 family endonuclease